MKFITEGLGGIFVLHKTEATSHPPVCSPSLNVHMLLSGLAMRHLTVHPAHTLA